MKKWDLPKGWEWKSFNDIGTIQSGGTPSTNEPQNFDGDIPWITPADLSNFDKKYISHGHRNISLVGVSKSSATIMPKGTILCSTRAPIGYVAIAFNPLTTNQGFKSLILKSDNIIPEYVFYYLKGNKQVFNNLASGTTFLEVSGSNFKKIPIPVPPLETQQKIVAILDKAEEVKRLRAEANVQTQKLIQSVFLDMFGDPVKNLKGWSVSRIGDITSKISSGSTPLGGREVYSKSGKLFIRSQNVLMNRLSLDDVAYIDNATHANMKRTWVNYGDVLLNITGASIGRVAWYDGENGSANVNQHVCIIRPNHKMILPEVLAFQISMPSFQQKIMMRQSGATRQAFTFTQISDFNIILPDIAIQNHFVAIMRAISDVDQKQKEQDSQLLISENNLLSKAFTGELVT